MQHGHIGELVGHLRDGVLLCRLVHRLDDASIDMNRVLEAGSAGVNDFLCRNNIFLFLHSCIQSFHLDNDYFFQPEDLYQCKNVARVIETLSALSHSPKVMKKFPSLKPFPKKEKTRAKKLKKVCGYSLTD